jgi:RNA polymerase sigma-70 factor (ECF subfamily)
LHFPDPKQGHGETDADEEDALRSHSPRPTPIVPEGVVRALPTAQSDAALVTALRSGSAEAAEQLFERYGDYVERLIVRVMGLDAEVPDLINEVFARAFERIEQLQDVTALKGWLGSITIFTARTFLRDRRSRRRFLGFFAPEELPEVPYRSAPIECSLALSRTYQVLATLAPDERIAFALRFIDGMSLGEVAKMMDVSIGTVKRRLTRAQQRFVSAAERDPLLREFLQTSERWGEP